jgi:uncharacterized protein (DUF58 family)
LAGGTAQSRSVSPKLRIYATFAAAGLTTGLVLGNTPLVALAAPFAALIVLGLVASKPRAPDLIFDLGADRVLEATELEAAIVIHGATGVAELELLPELPRGIASSCGAARLIVHVEPGQNRRFALPLIARRWGAYRLGGVHIRARDWFGLFAFDSHITASHALRVYPQPQGIRKLIEPFRTQPRAGGRASRAYGDGLEFADIRPFVSGEPTRRINWRVTARQRGLYVNDFRVERSSNVVLFLDTFGSAGGGDEVLDMAVRAASSLARACLVSHDRVGLVSFGGISQWITPGSDRAQAFRIIDTLLTSRITASFAPKDIDVLPPRSLPPQALVIALTPLLDDRAANALVNLRGRGFDLVIVEIPPPLSPLAGGSGEEELALRLWPLWRDALRFRYEQLGVSVVEWKPDRGLSELMEEARRFRRHAHRARV